MSGTLTRAGHASMIASVEQKSSAFDPVRPQYWDSAAFHLTNNTCAGLSHSQCPGRYLLNQIKM